MPRRVKSFSPEPVNSEEDDVDFQDNGLHLQGMPTGLEKVYDYDSGGHHPVILGDCLGEDGRYRVIHKLGNGGFANIWLCRDLKSETPKYIALKILMADESTEDCGELRVNKFREMGLDKEVGGDFICLPLEQFRIDGPNESHICFAYPVLGPRVSCVLQDFENPDKVLRGIALQAVQAMAALHSHGICHGDFTPSNILLRTSGLDGLAEEDVINALGKPELAKVLTASGEPPDTPSAPKYLVCPVDFKEVSSQFVSDQACVIDFGESFEAANPPENLGIPQSYCSPELVLDNAIGVGCDLWALGCTIFVIRTGRKLFGTFDDDVEDHLYAMVLLLGRFPEPWWTTTWEARKGCFEDEEDSQGRAIEINSAPVAQENTGTGEGAIIYQRPDPRSIKETLAKGLSYLRFEIGIHHQGSRDISSDEIDTLADLLGKILRYDPGQRLPAQKAQDHEWFRM